MNSKQLLSVVSNVNLTLVWNDFLIENPSQIKEVEKYAKFKYLQGVELNNAIQSIKDFDINKVWDKSFWGLKAHESICAVATEISQNIKKIKSF